MKHLIRFDWAVMRLLRNKGNFGILEGFLSELLLDDIKIDHILESESNQKTGDSKYNKVDLLVQNSKGELITIEIQSSRVQDYLMRILFGTSKLIVDNIDTRMGYDKIKKIISVNIVYFDLGQGEDYIYHGSTNFVGIHKHDTLKLNGQQKNFYNSDSIYKIYPEYYILKVNQFNEVATSPIDEWIYFLKNEVIKHESKARGLKQAKEQLDILKLSESELQEYENYISMWRYEESLTVSNFKMGKIEGIKEQQVTTALKCLENGISIEITAEISGLTVDEVVQLQG